MEYRPRNLLNHVQILYFKTNVTLRRCEKETLFLVSGAKKIKFPYEK